MLRCQPRGGSPAGSETSEVDVKDEMKVGRSSRGRARVNVKDSGVPFYQAKGLDGGRERSRVKAKRELGVKI